MKRLFDIILSAVLLIGLLPIMLLVAFAVMCFLGRPILFVQRRAGLNGKVFNIYKFRTMSGAVDTAGVPLSDQERLGRFGAFLRASSLDELPQLLNILKGDMSFVGPRPLLVEYLELYSSRQASRHDVMPGITGLAQINGRNDLGWDHKLELDAVYVERQSFWLDLTIMMRTIPAVLARRGVSKAGFVTTNKFSGSDETKSDEGSRQ